MQLNVIKRRIRFLFRRIKRHTVAIVLVGIVGTLMFGVVYLSKIASASGITPGFVVQLLFSSEVPLKTIENKTNILLLGMAGADHAGGDLADTIVVATIDFENNTVSTLSVPRDIWVPSMKDKVNTAYHYGQTRSEDGGFVLAKAAVEEVTGLPIQYIIRIDFNGFVRIIDTVGGLEIEVASGFVDTQYPIAGRENDLCDGDPEFACRYETVTFEKGLQHMDGERALKYVRSRHAQGTQGTDIARGMRQQQVLTALQKKILSFQSLFAFDRNKKLFEAINATIDSDMKISEMVFVGRSLMKARGAINSVILPVANLGEEQKGILFNPPVWQYDGRWVLIPPDEDFSLLHTYITCRLQKEETCEALLMQ